MKAWLNRKTNHHWCGGAVPAGGGGALGGGFHGRRGSCFGPKAVRHVPNVSACHGVRARGATGQIRVDLHVLVDANMSLFGSHEVAEAVTRTVNAIVPGSVEVLVHIGPVQKHGDTDNNGKRDSTS